MAPAAGSRGTPGMQHRTGVVHTAMPTLRPVAGNTGAAGSFPCRCRSFSAPALRVSFKIFSPKQQPAMVPPRAPGVLDLLPKPADRWASPLSGGAPSSVWAAYYSVARCQGNGTLSPCCIPLHGCKQCCISEVASLAKCSLVRM